MLNKILPRQTGESACNWFMRLRIFIENYKSNDLGKSLEEEIKE